MRFCARLAAAVVLCAIATCQAAVKLPSIIGDHMLLQRDVPVRIFGWADAGEIVTVRFAGQSVSATTGADGKWQAWLRPMPAGGPMDMSIDASNSITVRDVLVGDVWVASGQSNMVWMVQNSNNAEQEVATANKPRIRLFKVALKTSEFPLEDVEGSWMVCSPDTVKSFSAAGYFFARHLEEKLKVPIGVIQSAWGGTPAEAWTSRQMLLSDEALQLYLREWDQRILDYPEANRRFQQAVKRWENEAKEARKTGRQAARRPQPPAGPGHQHQPSVLYNAMIAPLTPYTIRGVIWYQGESNANRSQGSRYRHLFESMIRDWRLAWGLGDFPFFYVQLANYARPTEPDGWPLLRESQSDTLEVRNTGMAVTIDIGEAQDIHPKNKQDVGLRLALAARAVAYGENIVYSGPRFRQATTEGNRIRLWFDHVGGGLKAKGGELQGFVIAGENRRFVPATAVIEGDTIVVGSESVKEPLAVRYAWANNPVCNLYNAEDLPASPFRTDRWPNARMPE